MDDLLRAVARIRPELALEKLESNNNLDSVARTALQTLGARDPKAARQFLDRFTDTKTRKAAEIAIAQGVAESDPLAAVALARQMNEDTIFQSALLSAERISPGMVRQVFVAADGRLDGAVESSPYYPDLASDIKDEQVWQVRFGRAAVRSRSHDARGTRSAARGLRDAAYRYSRRSRCGAGLFVGAVRSACGG
jgi:hypothetical protein